MAFGWLFTVTIFVVVPTRIIDKYYNDRYNKAHLPSAVNVLCFALDIFAWQLIELPLSGNTGFGLETWCLRGE